MDRFDQEVDVVATLDVRSDTTPELCAHLREAAADEILKRVFARFPPARWKKICVHFPDSCTHAVGRVPQRVNRQGRPRGGKSHAVNATSETNYRERIGRSIVHARNIKGDVSGNELTRRIEESLNQDDPEHRRRFSRGRLADYEHGRIRPDDDMLERILRVLGFDDPTDIGWFYQRHEAPAEENAE